MRQTDDTAGSRALYRSLKLFFKRRLSAAGSGCPIFHHLGVVVLSAVLAGCGTFPRVPFTAADQAEASVPGFQDVRFWAGDESSAPQAAQFKRFNNLHYLALSGGGGDGGFGAGFLNGWTRTGARPEFTVVSGVSTGALTAPFAFLGPAYDDTLREMYTSGYGSSLFESPSLLNAVFGSGVFDNSRLRSVVRQFVTADVVALVAREHLKGRRLFIVTTNLDAQRPVVWSMGAIAASGAPNAVELFRSVLTASASIPGVFSPTMITAQANGRLFQEMHVDGGVTSNIFILPHAILTRDIRLGAGAKVNFYVIMNGKIEPSFTVVDNRAAEIVGRAVATMTQVQSRSTLQAARAFALRNGFGFYLAHIEADVPEGGAMGFDTGYMRRIYAYGYNQAMSEPGRTARAICGIRSGASAASCLALGRPRRTPFRSVSNEGGSGRHE